MQQLFKEKGIKLTPQRLAIYESLIANKSHPSVKDVYIVVSKKIPSISFDTVFRTLNLFSKKGLVDVASSASGVKRYDPNIYVHHHFECIRCGNIIDIEDDVLPVKSLLNKLKDQHEVLNCKLVMSGLCEKCKQ